ncbi:DUF262 domain-containing protein [Methylomarinum vadi]|uniref:DUF262 domain-containing protein n=1 Tax=Methylomarinum vadi TaxID=438855 RepID=UPI0004DFB94E|nr:DUF262 domain-containing protein [Methylomarinum vadi]
MSLESEITKASQDIVKDGYEMSIGELMNLYRDEELIIDPEFQRYFRWDLTRKSRFIESLLLGIPIPPIFVFQNESGVWELIDGLQRLSTIFEFVGILKGPDGDIVTPEPLEATKMLPSLVGVKWVSGENGLSKPLQLQIRRSRIRVEILTKESDSQSKYELFQRLNTGGASLNAQEVRNCVIVKVNSSFYKWLKETAEIKPFLDTLSITTNAEQQQKNIELALRFFVVRNIPYEGRLDINEYLDEGAISLATSREIDLERELDVFFRTFSLIDTSLGEDAFRKFNGRKFSGGFLISGFEALSHGISINLKDIEGLGNDRSREFIFERTKELWSDETFKEFTKAGVRGTTRLQNLIPFSKDFFKP